MEEPDRFPSWDDASHDPALRGAVLAVPVPGLCVGGGPVQELQGRYHASNLHFCGDPAQHARDKPVVF